MGFKISTYEINRNQNRQIHPSLVLRVIKWTSWANKDISQEEICDGKEATASPPSAS